jgi:type II secretory pathway pseudopilin PulG
MVNCAVIESKSMDGFDLEHDTISPRIFDADARNLTHFFEHKSPFKLLAAIAIPNTSKATQTLAYNQTLANEAQIVCALERFRLANGNYPETLDALVPQFIEKLPHDIIGGQPLHYRRTDPPSQSFGAASGKFLLYSVGWNETDDGGQVVLKPDGSEDRGKGDWVWRYPLK